MTARATLFALVVMLSCAEIDALFCLTATPAPLEVAVACIVELANPMRFALAVVEELIDILAEAPSTTS